MSNTVQGRYADPEGSDQLRWWDGSQWSDHFRPAPTGDETPVVTQSEPSPQAAPPPTGAPIQVPAAPTPAAPKPSSRPPSSQIITAGFLTLLAIFFIGCSALAATSYVKSGEELQQAQSDYDQAKQKLQEAKDEAK